MRVAVIRFSSLGDCVLLFPLLAHLKASGVEEVTVVTKTAFAPVFAYAQGVDRVVAYDPSSGPRGLLRVARSIGRGDLTVIDAHNNWRSRFLCWRLGGAAARFRKYYRQRLGLIVAKRPASIPTILEQYARLAEAAGLPPAPVTPGGFTVPASVRARVADEAPRVERAIALAPGSRWPAKRWPAECYVDLATALVAAHDAHVVLVGDASDADAARPIAQALGSRCTDATGDRSVVETAAWIERCAGFVGNDSGLMHVAEAVGVPVVGIFGPTVREFGYFPALENSRTVERDVDCRPCSRNGARPCPRERQVCLDIDAAAVEAAVSAMLEGRGERRTVLQ